MLTLVRKHGGKNDAPRRNHQGRFLGHPFQTDQPAFDLNQSGVVLSLQSLFRRDRGGRHRSGGRPPSENSVCHSRGVLVGGGKPHYIRHIAQGDRRSEEHTSELQSLRHLVCRLLLEKKTTE